MSRILRRCLSNSSNLSSVKIYSSLCASCQRCPRFSTSTNAEKDETGDEEPEKKTVLTAKLHENFSKSLEAREFKYRKHPGVRPSPCVRLPALHEMSAKRAISRYLTADFRERVVKHERNFKLIQLPDEEEDLFERAKLIRQKTESYFPISMVMEQDEREHILKKRQAKFEKEMAKRATTWRQIDYDDENAAVYCASRFVGNYAALRWVFRDLSKSDPNFKPKTLFDFGSGLGTTMHVANETWPNSINEHMNVDLSKAMNDLSDFILRNGDESRPQLYPGVYYREYLPLSSTIKYDLVVSAFTLLELPSRKSRVEAIEALWQKTADTLVIIETGSRFGFSCVLEARNAILQGAGYDVNKSFYEMDPAARELQLLDPYSLPSAYIEGPCPHHLACPRLFTGGPILCNFPIIYWPLDIGVRGKREKSEFLSYIILRKGKKTLEGESKYPRINQAIKAKNRFAIVRMCCPDGSMKSVSFTKKKHKGDLYKLARRSNWGDLLPVTIHEEEKELHRWDKIKRANRESELDESDSDISDSDEEEGR